MSPFIGDNCLRVGVRKLRRISPKVASDDGRASIFADFLRFRRVYESFPADERCRNISGLEDGAVAGRRRHRSVMVLSRVSERHHVNPC